MYFWQELSRHGDRVALIDANGQALDYRALDAATDAFALGRAGRPLILLEMANSIDAVVAYLAALKARWPAILVNAGDEASIARMLGSFRPALHWSATSGLVATEFAEATPEPHEDLAILLSTSGTTGSTKLVRISREALDSNARSIAQYLELGAQERAITTLPPAYSYGLSVINSHLAAGGSTVLTGVSVLSDSFRQLVDQHRATSFAGVPYTYELLERSGFLDALPSSIRTMTQAGGALPTERAVRIARVAHAHGCRFFVMYGQTEATARMAYVPPELLLEHPDCIGRAIPFGRLTLVDPESGAPADSHGELVYSGPNVMMGYAESPADLVRGREVESLHTGDLAERVGPELFRIVGRKSRFIKLFGLRISLEEVEREAARSGFAIVATGDDSQLVLAAEDASIGETLVRSISTRYGLPLTAMTFLAMPAMPRLPSGKPDYRAILARASERTPEPAASLSKRAAVEQLFRRTFSDRLVTPQDTFLTLHGDSLSYVSVSVGLEELIDPVPADWERTSIADLADLAEGLQSKTRRSGLVSWLETGVVIRSITPITIALFHYHHLELVAGGAAVLMVLSGLNFARFSLPDLLAVQPGRILGQFLVNVLIPYWTLVFAYGLAKHDLSVWEVVLLNNFVRAPSVKPFWTWFVQVLLQSILLTVGLFAVPSFRTNFRKDAFRALCVPFTGALLAMTAYTLLDGPSTHLAWQYWLFLLGFLIAVVRTRTQKVFVSALIAVIAVTTYSSPSRVVYFVLGVGLLIWTTSLPVPSLLRKPIGLVAASSLFIYMLHERVPARFSPTVDLPIDFGRVILALVVGVVTWHLYQGVVRQLRARLKGRPP